MRRQLKLRREAAGLRAGEFGERVGYGEDMVYKIEGEKRIPRPGVEVAATPGTVHVRDSKFREAGPRFSLTPAAWARFLPFASEG